MVRFGHKWDHGMVTAELHLRISKFKPRAPQPDRAWLDDERNAPAFDQAYLQAKKAPENQTMDADFEQISSAISVALKSVPPPEKQKKMGRGSSKRTCDLIAERTSFLQGVELGTPEFKSRKAVFQKLITAIIHRQLSRRLPRVGRRCARRHGVM